MKRKYLICIAAVLLMLTSFSAFALAPNSGTSEKTVTTADGNKVLESRFLNMLNHNFAYGEDFYSVEDLTNSSVLALLNTRETDDSDYIRADYVKDYLFNMYGVSTGDLSEVNSSFPQKSGYVYIIPRGFSVYKHSNPVISLNEDGTYSVITDVKIESHDGSENLKAVSLFAVNKDSSFGYSMISSRFIDKTSDI